MTTAPCFLSSAARGQLVPIQQQQEILRIVAPAFQRRRSAMSAFAKAIFKSSRNYSCEPASVSLHKAVAQDAFDLWKPRSDFQSCHDVRHVSLIESVAEVTDRTTVAKDDRASIGEEVAQMKEKFRMDAKTGAFQQLPMVSPAYEILGSAQRKARMVRPTKGIMNVAKRERNRGAKQLDALIKELALPLKMYIQKFPQRQQLHAYESALLELTLGDGKYEEVLERVDYLRKKVLDLGKNCASLCAKSTTKVEAVERLAEGFAKLEQTFNKHGNAVDDLKEHAKKLRAMPVISLRTPTLCLVGAPNVGKSSLVRILSSGKPEICNYQFTTRGISLGHFEVDSRRFQVTDTPGLLERPDDERNNMEKLTLAALSHLPTSILYVHDLTGECGSSPAKQFNIYKAIKGKYSDRPWLDVVSKADLLSPPTSRSSSLDLESIDSYVQCGPQGALWVSTETGEGVAELEEKVHALLVKAHPDQSKDEDSTYSKAQHDVDAKPVQDFYYPAWPSQQEN